MNTSNYLSFNDIEKLCEEKTEAIVYCKHCGHSMNISKKIGKRICSHCGNYAFVNDKEWIDIDNYKNHNQIEWVTNFYDRFIKNLPEDTLITVYECVKN